MELEKSTLIGTFEAFVMIKNRRGEKVQATEATLKQYSTDKRNNYGDD